MVAGTVVTVTAGPFVPPRDRAADNGARSDGKVLTTSRGTHREVVGQASFDELGTRLSDTTFCVVDLETTGQAPRTGGGITEVGAVKVRHGEVLGEFQTLVDPGEPVPPFISTLTGITDGMVFGQPRITSVLPAFLEFARGSVLVAHNAPFDVGFLTAAAAEQDIGWPGFDVIDTAVLARRVLTRDEVPNCKLSTLAVYFHATTAPVHRALDDARATVDVLHGLIERLGGLGVHTVEELRTFSARVSDAQRRKRHLADGIPEEPGVYLFLDRSERVLYVGTSGNLRKRVRSYFTSAETRTRIGEMVGLAAEVRTISCATALEAQVRELRLIHAHKPRYNRRSKFPERQVWLKVTVEPFPRLSMVKKVGDDGATYLGPFGSRRAAEQAATAMHEATKIRQCGGRMSKNPRMSPCALAEMGRCLAPCDGHLSVEEYEVEVQRLREAISASPVGLVRSLLRRIRRLASGERFEEASRHRDRMAAFLQAAERTQRLRPVAEAAQIVAARRREQGGYDLHVVRYGRLAAAGFAPPGTDPMPMVASLLASAETVPAPTTPPLPAGSIEEAEILTRWLDTVGVRLISVEGELACPVDGAGSLKGALQQAYAGRDTIAYSGIRRGDSRRGRPEHRPPR